MAPMLLLVGDRNKTVPYFQALQMDEALKKAGVKHDTHIYPGIDHSFLGTTLEATREANQDALERTVRLIDATIGSASRWRSDPP
jgi:dipeptidyl aminopeptidase/acylaminoacyl peptidase